MVPRLQAREQFLGYLHVPELRTVHETGLLSGRPKFAPALLLLCGYSSPLCSSRACSDLVPRGGLCLYAAGREGEVLDPPSYVRLCGAHGYVPSDCSPDNPPWVWRGMLTTQLCRQSHFCAQDRTPQQRKWRHLLYDGSKCEKKVTSICHFRSFVDLSRVAKWCHRCLQSHKAV